VDTKTIPPDLARETYRYLRIGLMGAAVLLAAAVLYERLLVDCWQGSISSYYFTPARGVFIGVLVVVGVALIVIQGEGAEDICLNIAGMLAPLVAFVPTRNVGDCWSIEPDPLPLVPSPVPGEPDVLAGWVVSNVDNNVAALVFTGLAGLVFMYILFSAKKGPAEAFRVNQGDAPTRKSLWIAAAIITATGLAWWLWDGFADHAHNIAAIGMFVFMAIAAWLNANRDATGSYVTLYRFVAGGMILSAVVILGLAYLLGDRWDHAILVLEGVELTLFALYWAAQTKEHWYEKVEPV
jgi:hypothetical protein